MVWYGRWYGVCDGYLAAEASVAALTGVITTVIPQTALAGAREVGANMPTRSVQFAMESVLVVIYLPSFSSQVSSQVKPSLWPRRT